MATKILTIPLENTPGKLGEAARTLAEENVNILAIESTSFGEIGLARIVTDKPDVAERALRSKGHQVQSNEVLEIELPNRPGELAKVCETLGRSDVNIEGLWAGPVSGSGGRVLIRVDDPETARQALKSITPQTVTR